MTVPERTDEAKMAVTCEILDAMYQQQQASLADETARLLLGQCKRDIGEGVAQLLHANQTDAAHRTIVEKQASRRMDSESLRRIRVHAEADCLTKEGQRIYLLQCLDMIDLLVGNEDAMEATIEGLEERLGEL